MTTAPNMSFEDRGSYDLKGICAARQFYSVRAIP